jgi:hypothetical protein
MMDDVVTRLLAKLEVPFQQPDPLTCTFKAVWREHDGVEYLETSISRAELRAIVSALQDVK